MDGPALPPTLARIERAAGRYAAIQIARQAGGDRLYIPHDPDTGSGAKLAQMVGAPAAAAIIQWAPGKTLYIPKARQEIAAWLASRGATNAAIADELGVTRDTARKYAAPYR